MNTIVIQAEEIKLEAVLNDSRTAKRIYESLPLEGEANIWGDEIYFTIPVLLDQESDARADVGVGELGYWPVGSAFCIFYGPTPVSINEMPRAYSPVNVFGKISGDAGQLRKVNSGVLVKVTKK
jgi:hypothetical protein